MQFLNVRGAVTAAAMIFVSLCGATPGVAKAETPVSQSAVRVAPGITVIGTAPIVAAATPSMSGSAWIAQGTTIAPGATQTMTPAVSTVPAMPAQASSLTELVGDMPIESDLAPDMKCLAQAVYFESRGEPIEGQLAVAEVVINRARSGDYPTDYCSVVTQPAQFSFVHHGVIPSADEASVAWQRAKAIAEIAQKDLWRTKAADALYFHATYVRPTWARQKVELAQIETHIFYR